MLYFCSCTHLAGYVSISEKFSSVLLSGNRNIVCFNFSYSVLWLKKKKKSLLTECKMVKMEILVTCLEVRCWRVREAVASPNRK